MGVKDRNYVSNPKMPDVLGLSVHYILRAWQIEDQRQAQEESAYLPVGLFMRIPFSGLSIPIFIIVAALFLLSAIQFA